MSRDNGMRICANDMKKSGDAREMIMCGTRWQTHHHGVMERLM